MTWMTENTQDSEKDKLSDLVFLRLCAVLQMKSDKSLDIALKANSAAVLYYKKPSRDNKQCGYFFRQ